MPETLAPNNNILIYELTHKNFREKISEILLNDEPTFIGCFAGIKRSGTMKMVATAQGIRIANPRDPISSADLSWYPDIKSPYLVTDSGLLLPKREKIEIPFTQLLFAAEAGDQYKHTMTFIINPLLEHHSDIIKNIVLIDFPDY